MALKKTESITYRTDTVIKSILTKLANEKKWTISQLFGEIIREWLQDRLPGPSEQQHIKTAARVGGSFVIQR